MSIIITLKYFNVFSFLVGIKFLIFFFNIAQLKRNFLLKEREKNSFTLHIVI